MVESPRHPDVGAPVDGAAHAKGEIRDRLMAALFGLVESGGWRWVTVACAVAVMVVGLVVTAAVEALIGPAHDQQTIAVAVICLVATPCFAIAFKLVEHLGATRAKLMVEIDRRIVAEQQLRHLATTDELTGLSNRRRFVARGREVAAVARRDGHWCSLAVIDIDRFKDINDRRGHLAGDAALMKVAALLQGNLRASDLAGRLGGDEFVVLMPLAGPEAASTIAERLAAAVRQGCPRLGLSVSIGVASALGGEAMLDELMQRADRALYAAKEAGRNRVMLDEDDDDDGAWPRVAGCRLSLAS